MAPLYVTVLEGTGALAPWIPAWESLARRSLEPNAFHEPWLMLPGLEAFGAGKEVLFVLVHGAAGPQADALPELLGLFPLEYARRYRGLPLRHLRLWRHRHCFLGTPLLDAARSREVLSRFLDWVADDARSCVVEWEMVAADGPFLRALNAVMNERRQPVHVAYSYERGLLCRRASPEDYLNEALPRESRRELRRLERRLGEQGSLAYEELTQPAETGDWVERFLAVEASGWKGQRGSALASTEANRHFFTRAATLGAERGRLMMLEMRLDGRPVAAKCNFLAAAGGGFTFKIGYDEAYRRYSPGTLLELENIRRFHQRPALSWMDSCAAPDHFMINRLWLDRRALLTCVTATGRAPGDLVVSALPLARWLYRRVSPALKGVRA
jgi:CelD/BcsL family acetyltransferase involved in cellulose biosynthesis